VEWVTIEAIADELVSDVREGIDDTDVRAGIIGELGVSSHIHEAEEKAFRAALRTVALVTVCPAGSSRGQACRPTGSSSGTWTGRGSNSARSPSRISGGSLTAGPTSSTTCGGRRATRTSTPRANPSDPERIDAIETLIHDGYLANLLFSHDVCLKIQRAAYGGHGYWHLQKHAVPMLRDRGLSAEQIAEITRENPRRMLAFKPPA
jgi:phosphotriesterase-related protein